MSRRRMATIAMWSGGKDSSLALWRAMEKMEVDSLVCMMQHGKARLMESTLKLLRRRLRA